MDTYLHLSKNDDPVTFARLKQVLACRADDSERMFLNMASVEQKGRGITITATNGKSLRQDKFNLKADPGIYAVQNDADQEIKLLKKQDVCLFPDYASCIPKYTKKNCYSIEGSGPRFVTWAAAVLGVFLDPSLIHLEPNEYITVYVLKQPESAVMIKNHQTLMIVMPMKINDSWVDALERINRKKLLSAIIDNDCATQEI